MECSNSSISNTTEHSALTPDSVLYRTGIGMMAFCFLLGITGNIAVIAMILRHLKQDNFTLQLMLNLAVTDLVSLATVPVWIYDKLQECAVPKALCTGVSFVVYASLYASVLTVCLMSLHRYLVVLHRRRWDKLGRTGERALLLGLWACACALAAPEVTIYDVLKEHTGQLCVQVTESHGQKVAVLSCETLMGFVVPVAIIGSSYYQLHKQVNQTVHFRSRRLTRTVTLIVVTFIVFWIPLHVTNVLEILSPQNYADAKLPYVYRSGRLISESLSFANSSVNPFLYAFEFRGLSKCSQSQESKMENSMTGRSVTRHLHVSQTGLQSLG